MKTGRLSRAAFGAMYHIDFLPSRWSLMDAPLVLCIHPRLVTVSKRKVLPVSVSPPPHWGGAWPSSWLPSVGRKVLSSTESVFQGEPVMADHTRPHCSSLNAAGSAGDSNSVMSFGSVSSRMAAEMSGAGVVRLTNPLTYALSVPFRAASSRIDLTAPDSSNATQRWPRNRTDYCGVGPASQARSFIASPLGKRGSQTAALGTDGDEHPLMADKSQPVQCSTAVAHRRRPR